MNKDIKKIDPDQFYTAKNVVDMKILPCKSRATFYKMLLEPKWSKIFKPIVDRKNILTRYSIRGENIINYINLRDSGKLNTLEKTNENKNIK